MRNVADVTEAWLDGAEVRRVGGAFGDMTTLERIQRDEARRARDEELERERDAFLAQYEACDLPEEVCQECGREFWSKAAYRAHRCD